ncbi:MAG: DinB family protein [Trueperaceae bacterium]|nr:DinB family protein [Trueperaceae bacterium]
MTVLYGPPAETLELLLDDPDNHEFASARDLLKNLSGEQAAQSVAGLPYTIAEILAHMNSNLYFNLELIASSSPETFVNPYENWPKVNVSDWSELVESFLSGLDRAKAMARESDLNRILFPATKAEPAWTLGYKLAMSVAKHNAYHFGQIGLLRRLLGVWLNNSANT